MRAFLGLGSNLGDRRAELARAVAGLPDVVAVSRLYETEPVGGPAGQGPYLNLVVELDTELGPRELLDVARRLEAAAGAPARACGGARAPSTSTSCSWATRWWTTRTSSSPIPACGSDGSWSSRWPSWPPISSPPAPEKGLVERSRWWVDWLGTDPIAWSDRHPR